MQQGVDVTTNYHAFVSKLDFSMQSLLDKVRVNTRANGGGSVTWADVVAICRDQLSRVALVPSSVIGSGNSILSENSTLGSIGLTKSDGVGVATLAGQVASSNLSIIGLMQSSR